jgi:HTH-type transcriptional regulator/antitoxin HigA
MSKRTAKPAARSFSRLPRTFDGLCRLWPLRPIRGESDWENAMEVIHVMAGHDLNADQEDYLDVLSTLVGEYEDEHHAIDTSAYRGLPALKYLVEVNGMTASELGELLGNRSLGSKLLRGERQMSKAHIRKLAERFKVSPALFLEA